MDILRDDSDSLIGHNVLVIPSRFFCACTDSLHILDVNLGDGEVTMSFCVTGKSPWRFRLKQILNLLRGRNGEMCDFVLRDEDVPQLTNLLLQSRSWPCTVSNVLDRSKVWKNEN